MCIVQYTVLGAKAMVRNYNVFHLLNFIHWFRDFCSIFRAAGSIFDHVYNISIMCTFYNLCRYVLFIDNFQ